jgi:hypothetical protein
MPNVNVNIGNLLVLVFSLLFMVKFGVMIELSHFKTMNPVSLPLTLFYDF